MLFELITERYERRSILITANQPFSGWDTVFPVAGMTVAAIDRLVHHAHAHAGQRWRLSETQLASYRADGLVRPRLRFDDVALESMRDLLDRTLQATPGHRPESLVCPLIEAMTGLPASIAAECPSVCTAPKLLDVVSQVIGSDVIL